MKKKMMLLHFLFLFGFAPFLEAQNWRDKTEKAEFIHRAIKEVTDVMVYDIYSPPVTSRTYAYIAVAGYEALVPSGKEYVSLAGQLHGLTPLPKPDAGKEMSYTLAAVHAILTTARALVISEEKIDTFQNQMKAEFMAAGMPEEAITNSLYFGQQIAQSILAWAAKDKYRETRALPKFAVADEDPATWKPTPPAYIKAVEPNWNKMRTFVIDSAAQFKPNRPPLFLPIQAVCFTKKPSPFIRPV